MPKISTSWKPGQTGNPLGRPKGSRDTINEAFLKDLAADSAWMPCRRHERNAQRNIAAWWRA